jgi:hypothetical protein
MKSKESNFTEDEWDILNKSILTMAKLYGYDKSLSTEDKTRIKYYAVECIKTMSIELLKKHEDRKG